MKIKTRIINVLYLDENSVELTTNTIIGEQSEFDVERVIRGDILHMKRKMVQGSPKVFKIVVTMDFYKKNKLNICEYIDIEVTI